MARRVWKFPLALRSGEQFVDVPAGASIVHLHSQVVGGGHRPVMWAEVDDSAPTTVRTFYVVATGESIPFEARQYLGTVHIDWTVWHVYERGRFV